MDHIMRFTCDEPTNKKIHKQALKKNLQKKMKLQGYENLCIPYGYELHGFILLGPLYRSIFPSITCF